MKLSDVKPLTYKSKRVVKLAPDVLVYINGKPLVTGCPSCGKKITLDDITDISTSLAVEGSPGSASVTLAASSTGIKKYFFKGRLVFSPMMEIEIFAKGRFPVGADQNIVYYPVFWGFVTDVGYDYSGGQHTISITCKDILYWWSILTLAITPSGADALTQGAGWKNLLSGNDFIEKNPFEIIWALNNSLTGSAIFPDNFTGKVGVGGAAPPEKDLLHQDLMKYWQERFKSLQQGGQVVRGLQVFGLNGRPITFNDKGQSIINGKLITSTRMKENQYQTKMSGLGPDGIDEESVGMTQPTLRDLFDNTGQWQSTTTTGLELMEKVKRWIGYEFYMDVTGDIVFKPPFYNIDVRDNYPVSNINPQDIIHISINEVTDSIVTEVDVSGKLDLLTEDTGQFVRGTYIDYDLLRKYGLRKREVHMGGFSTSDACFAYAVQECDRLNALRWQGSVTIPMRPELRLGFPVYIDHLDAFFYVTGINHNLSYGSVATTQLSLTAMRKKYVTKDPPVSGKLVGMELGPDDKLVGAPNRTVVFVKEGKTTATPIEDKSSSVEAFESQAPECTCNSNPTVDTTPTTTTEPVVLSGSDYLPPEFQASGEDLQRTKLSVRYLLSTTSNTGVWEEQEFDTTNDTQKDLINRIGVSDKEGFELVGGLPYGKNLSVRVDGTLTLSPKTGANDSFSSRMTSVSPDLADINMLTPETTQSTNYRVSNDKTANISLNAIRMAPEQKSLRTCICGLQTDTIAAGMREADAEGKPVKIMDELKKRISVSSFQKGVTRLGTRRI